MAYTNIDDPSAHFQTKIYSGQNSVQSVTNDGNSNLKPDWLWIKSRNDSDIHVITNSTTGTDLYLQTNNDAGEVSSTGDVESFDTNGFSLAGVNDRVNTNGGLFVAWQWKANGGTTASNSDGNITATVQANTDAGFSIVTYTGNGSNNQTIGHGLGVQPSWWIVKRRDTTGDWWFGASSILGGTSNYLKLNSNAANAEINNIWGDSPTSSTLFRVSDNAGLNASSGTYVAYLFSNKQGYSKFGKYVGNGASDAAPATNGPFIYTGFSPAFVLIKKISAVDDWLLFDNKRAGYDPAVYRLFPGSTSAETSGTNNTIQFTSNGFKIRFHGGSMNTSGGEYIYMAFAESPFVTSTGIPTTAR